MQDTTIPKVPVRQFDLGGAEGAEAVIKILRETANISKGEVLEVELGCIPFQLYDLLQQRGLIISYTQQSGKKVIGRIARR